ncbi:MAG TPA: tetratricopeptide repeat protein [Chthoniobacterales bacterium]|nr:tetratricopeptide repeat protein [Chthoniobacterales bacterium]
MDPRNFFSELRRRNVYKAAVGYAAVGWLVIQVATSTFPVLQIPAWAMRLVVVLVLLGFPIALVLAWAFEMTPEGIKRTVSVGGQGVPARKRLGWIVPIIVVLAIVAWLFLGGPNLRQRFFGMTGPEQRGETGGKSIAVLPFASLSEDKANAYFAEGIQDEILTRLANIGELKVISRTSTLRYKSTPENLTAIAKELGVAHILEGSVQKSGDRVRINVQLINAETDTHLWAETFDRTVTDLFAVESEVAQRVADSLRAKLTGLEKVAIATKATENPAAYDAYLRGLAVVASNRESVEAFTSAADYFDAAVRLDPKFAQAWARASVAHSRMYWASYDRTPARVEKAKLAAEKARELAPGTGETFLASGYFEYMISRDYDAAAAAFKEALARLPNNTDTLVALSLIERRKALWAEAVAHQEQAARLDPQSVPVLSQLGITYFALKRFADAHTIVDRLLGLAPENPQVLAGLARLNLAEGNLEAAEKAMRSVPPSPSTDYIFEIQLRLPLIAGLHAEAIKLIENAFAHPPAPAGFFAGKYRYQLGFAKELAGDATGARAAYETARAELMKVLEAQPASAEAHLYLALALAGLGEKDPAFSAAQKAIALRPSVDAVVGASFDEAFARVKARFGENDAAIADLRRLLSTKYIGPEQIVLTPALLRLDPAWIPLRNDPRFQELLSEK